MDIKVIDFSDCPEYIYNFGGNSKKIIVQYNENPYMLKFEEKPRDKHTELSYTNHWISEYISCHCIEQLGIPVQETLLGTYKNYNVVACKDFTNNGFLYMQEFKQSITSFSDSINQESIVLTDILLAIEKQNIVPKEELLERFWDQFVIDSYIGNSDRHNGNWGYLIDRQKNVGQIAPIYDCGAALYPIMDERKMTHYLNTPQLLKNLVINEPVSMYKEGSKKINYYQFFKESDNKDLHKSIEKIVPRINLEYAYQLINKIPCISNTQKEFYSKVLQLKKELILEPTLKRIRKNSLQKPLLSISKPKENGGLER